MTLKQNIILHTVYVYSNTASHDIPIMTIFQETTYNAYTNQQHIYF